MKSLPRAFVMRLPIVLLPLLLGGCVMAVNTNPKHFVESDWQDRQAANARAIARLELGQSRELVMLQLGEPDFT